MNHLTAKPVNANDIDIRTVLYELVKNRRLILNLMLVAVLCGVIVNYFRIPKYQGDVLIRIQEPASPSMNNAAIQNLMLMNNKNAAMYSALLHSRYILSPTINTLGLNLTAKSDRLFHNDDKIQIKKFSIPSSVINKPLFLTIDTPQHFRLYDKKKLLLEGPLDRLVSNSDKTIVLQVNLLAGETGSRFIITKRADTKIIEKLLPHLTVTDLGGMSGKNEKTGILQVSYVDKNPTRLVEILNTAVHILQQKNIEQKSLKAKETLNFLQEQLPLAKKSLETAETVFNKYRATSKKLDIKVEMQFLLNELADLDRQLTGLRLNRRALLLENTEDHPFIHEIDEKSQSLLLERKKLEDKLKLLPASDQVAVSLMRDISVKQELYLELLKKIQELKVEEASTVSDIQILSWAKLPDTSLPPHYGLVLLASAVLGFVLSCIILFARKMVFPKVNDPYWVEQHLGLANIAIVPYSEQQHGLSTPKILAQAFPKDLTLEALRSLRTNLQVLLYNAANNIISMVGLSPQIGKSFISVNLAYLLAEAGKRVLLIDGDLRQGHIQDYFNIMRSPGLSEILNNTHVVEQAVRTTSHPNLMLLTTGTLPAHPSELLMKERCDAVIRSLATQFDIVIIDTAPILAVTDAAIIGRFAGTNLLVLGADSHQSVEIEMAVKQLSNANVKLHGSIYNNLKKEQRLSEMLRQHHYYRYKQSVVHEVNL